MEETEASDTDGGGAASTQEAEVVVTDALARALSPLPLSPLGLQWVTTKGR